MDAPVIIIGAGLAGLSVALSLAPRPCVVLGRKAASGQTSSEWAQGGIAAAVGVDDAPSLHESDTLNAGAGLCNPLVAHLITQAAPSAISLLETWGVVFDSDESGALKTGLEAAHSRRRIVHAQGDSTGASIMRAVLARVWQTPSITLWEDVLAEGLVLDAGGGIAGVSCRADGDGSLRTLRARAVVLATGSACALWSHTTVPLESWGHGLFLAAEAGAVLHDLEFVQFHPTGLDVGLDPMPLISEAVRGDGARLVDDRGEVFVDALAPRDVVARAIWRQRQGGGGAFLDARALPDFAARFPTVFALCRAAGLDPSCHRLPVRPVAHYHMGGVATDVWGRTNVEGLWACGECAATGFHGANRLASNSLLEAVVMGQRVAQSLDAFLMRRGGGSGAVFADEGGSRPLSAQRDTPQTMAQVRAWMTRHVGVLRDEEGLKKGIDSLEALAPFSPRATVGGMIARAALERKRSDGAHYRVDEKEGDEDDRTVA